MVYLVYHSTPSKKGETLNLGGINLWRENELDLRFAEYIGEPPVSIALSIVQSVELDEGGSNFLI